MSNIIAMTEEQFEALVKRLEAPRVAGGAVGMGAAPLGAQGQPVGFGCGGYPSDDVFRYLCAGSPRLALAKALGIPFAPYYINVKATFSDASVSVVPDVGSDVKIVQDTVIEQMLVRVQSENAPSNQFQNETDYYANFQSGISATLDVQGAPRYSVAPKFTLLANLADTFNGSSRWPGCWILTYQQQLFMSFQAEVPLVNTPTDVWVTFRGMVPSVALFGGDYDVSKALLRLRNEFGIVVPQAYTDWCCR